MKSLLLPVLALTALTTTAFAQDAGGESTIDLDTCLDRAHVTNYVPGDAGFANASAPYNLRLDPHPGAVAYPTSAAEVAKAINCAKQRRLSVVSRSGGHSYAGWGAAEDNNGALVVDLAKLTSYSFNEKTGIAKVGPGLRLGDLALALFANGRAMPHGTCPTVGTGGHVAHGGYGFYSRLWGLALDRVVGHDVVLADGSAVHTSANSHPDLYWALKGAAPSFGIITKYYLTTEPVPTTNVRMLITWDIDAATAADAFIRWQTYLPSAPPELGMAFRMFKGQTNTTLRLDFLGQFFGNVDGLYAQLGDQINALPTPVTNIVEQIDWIPMLEWLAGTPLNTSTGPHVTDTFYAKSLAVYEDTPMTHDQILAFTTYLANTPTPLSWFAMADTWGGGSVINSIPLDATSFGSRSNAFGWQLYGWTPDSLPPFPASGIPFVQGMYDSIVNAAPAGWRFNAYSNYVDSEWSREEANKLYYGGHYPRLQRIKKRYDPGQLFKWPQSVTPA